jgi:putative heavy-metal-binding protein
LLESTPRKAGDRDAGNAIGQEAASCFIEDLVIFVLEDVNSERFSEESGNHRMKPSDDTPDPFKPPTDIIVVTTPFVSGYHVTRVIGATFGLIVRSRGLGQNIFAFFRAWGGGEIKVYTSLLEQVRH